MNNNKKGPTSKKSTTKTKTETTEIPQAPKQNKLYRSEDNKVLGGVAGGLGEYFDIDPVIARIIFILLILNGVGVILYLILWAIIPTKSKTDNDSDETFKENVAEIRGKAKSFASDLQTKSGKENARVWLGIVIIIGGALLFFENLGIFNFLRFDRLWPLLLVALGIVLLTKKNQD
jgi:phage shock protein C